MTRIELVSLTWKARTRPLYHTCWSHQRESNSRLSCTKRLLYRLSYDGQVLVGRFELPELIF